MLKRVINLLSSWSASHRPSDPVLPDAQAAKRVVGTHPNGQWVEYPDGTRAFEHGDDPFYRLHK